MSNSDTDFFPRTQKMAAVCLSINYSKPPFDRPSIQELKHSLFSSMVVLLGDIGAGSFAWDIQPSDVTTADDPRMVRVKIQMLEKYDKNSLSRFCAAVTMTKQVANERVVIRVVDS